MFTLNVGKGSFRQEKGEPPFESKRPPRLFLQSCGALFNCSGTFDQYVFHERVIRRKVLSVEHQCQLFR